MISLTANLRFWSNGEGGSHYLLLPDDQSAEVRFHARAQPRGFGSVRVECRIGELVWRTSLFPQKGGGYFLPMKIDACRRAGLAAGDMVTVALELL